MKTKKSVYFHMVLLMVALLFLAHPFPVSAQIPIFHQLISAYHRASPTILDKASATIQTNQLISNPKNTIWQTGSVLGQAVGGEGKIISIAILGDSMIDTLGADLSQLSTALANYYPGIKFLLYNYGYGGSPLKSTINRLGTSYSYQNRDYGNIFNLEPDIVVIESHAYNNYGNSQTGIDQHWTELSEITTKIKEKLPKSKIVLATTIAPNSLIFGNAIKDVHWSSMEKIEKTSTIKLYLQNTVNFATSQKYPLANAYHPSLNNNEGRAEYINADSIHPSGAGGEFFCETLAKTIYDNRLIED